MISRTFSNILSFFRKKSWFFLILGVFFFLQTQGVFAADPATQTGISAEDSNKLIGYLNGFLQMAAAILGLITGFISIFLYPGWVNGTMFGLQDYLKIIWVLVSNVVYFIFAGILIAIAFMNIIGKTDNNIWELKQAMPKFIVGVLIVPFSWFFIQFLLSLSAILTVGVLTLPYDSFQNEELFSAVLENESDDAIVNQRFCKSIIISLTGSFPEGATSVTEDDGGTFPEQIKCKSEDDKVSIKEIISGEGGGAGLDNNVFGIISVYTYGILKVQERDTLVQADLTTVKGVMDLVFKVIFDLLFVVVYMILMVALFLALMSRGIHLWVYMMLSPLFGLLYFFGKTGKEGFGDTGKNFSIGEFIALAMVPVYVAAALAFGLTFIMVASEGIKEKSSKDDLDTLSAGGFSLSIIGAHGDGEEEKSVIAKLIVQLFGVVILWIAVMAALKSSDVTNNVTQPIQSFGKSVGELIQKSPTYAPIIPAPGGMQSAASLQQIGSTLTGKMSQSTTERSGRLFGSDQTPVSSEVAAAQSNLSGNPGNNTLHASDLLKVINKAEGDAEKLYNNSDVRKYVTSLTETIPEIKALNLNMNDKNDFAKGIDRLIAYYRTKSPGVDFKLGDPSRVGDISTFKQLQDAMKQGATGATSSGSTSSTINITSNSTISGLVNGGKITGVGNEIDDNAKKIATEIETMLGSNTISRADIITRLTSINITDQESQNKIIDALGNSIT